MQVNISLTGLNPASQSRNFEKVQMNFHELHTVTSICNYSPIIFQGGIRKAENFLSAGSLILDFDGTHKLEKIKEERLAWIWGNSKLSLRYTSKTIALRLISRTG